tara:strand:+ start:49 stop:213 length:165 start_codon:yes stop_codon:yes gene_type:complete
MEKDFWKGHSEPEINLSNIKSSVLALDDSLDFDFCGDGKKVYEKSQELGAIFFR